MKAGVSVQRQVRAAAKSVAMERLPCKCRDRHIVRNFVEQGSAMDVFTVQKNVQRQSPRVGLLCKSNYHCFTCGSCSSASTIPRN